MKKSNLLLVLLFLISISSLNAQDYYFYGYQDTLWSNPNNWDSFNGYPGTTIPAGEYARIPSNYSLGRCSLDVDVINNGRILLQSKFYFNGHSITNNDLIEFTGTVWGALTNEPTGTLSLGWEPYFYTRAITVNGSLTNTGLIPFDFNGTDDSHDLFFGLTTANLGGEIEIRFRDGFDPVINQEYILIHTDNNGVSGTFATETFPAGVVGSIIYEHNRVKVVFTVGPLPVEMTNFEVTQQDQNTLLTWVTASEKNNEGFEIQKSNDGKDWQSIGFVEGKGTTNSKTEYQYVDTHPFSGINYYRLQQIDYDGAFDYSDMVAIEFSRITNQVNVYPNPSTSNVNIQVDNPFHQKMQITIHDYLGMLYWESGLIVDESLWKQELEIEQNGIYFITVQIGNDLYTDRIIISGEK